MARVRSPSLRVGPARLSYPFLYQPQTRKREDGSEHQEYSCSLVFPPGFDLKPLKQLANEAMKEAFGAEKIAKMKDAEKVHNPFLDGGKPKFRDNPGMGAGVMFIRCNSQNPPSIVDQKVRPVPQSVGMGMFSAGVLVYAVVHVYTWENKKNGIGCTFGIDSLQFARDDGTRFGGGGVKPDDYFEKIEDDTGGGEDAPDDPFDESPAPARTSAKRGSQTAEDLF